MEQDTQNLLEMIDRPAFLVQGGVITYANQMAKNRQIALGTPIAALLAEAADAYENFQGGTLYLTLNIGWVKCGATVMPQNEDHIFLLDRDADTCQLQALALAGQQLRTPLSNVMTVADSLFPELTEPQQKEQASQMTRALFQLMRLVSNMADAERYSGLESPTFENTELCSFFREIAEKANEALAENKISVRFECREKAIFSAIDRERIQRAVYNLLSNAVKFSEPDGCVKITLTRSKKLACLTVENQGDGIASHVTGSLFHRYMREPAIEDSRFGLGLGMTLVRSTAAAHGGTVLLENTGGARVAMTMAITKETPGSLRSPRLRIGDYAGGRDLGLLEFSDSLPASSYEKDI